MKTQMHSGKSTGRQQGKSASMERVLRQHTLNNPNTTIARCSIYGMIVEKPVNGERIYTNGQEQE